MPREQLLRLLSTVSPGKLDRIAEPLLVEWMETYDASSATITVGRRDEKATLGWSPVISFFPKGLESRREIAKRWYTERDLAECVQLRKLLEEPGKPRTLRVRALLGDDCPVSLVGADLAGLGERDRMVGAYPTSESSEVYVVLGRAEDEFVVADEQALIEDLRAVARYLRWLALGTGVLSGAKPFTNRERQVSSLLLSGRSEGEIASALGLASGSVHQIIVRVFRKLGVRSRAELMALWLWEPDTGPAREPELLTYP